MIEINLTNVLLLIGLIQGIVLALVALFVKPTLSRRLFAIILGILCLSILDTVLFDEVSFREYTFTSRVLIGFFPLDLIMPLGPLLLFYCQSIFVRDFELTGSKRFHFIPTVFDFLPWLYAIPFLILLNMKIVDKTYLDYWIKPFWDNNVYHDAIKYIWLSIYLMMCFRYLKTVKLGADLRTYRWARDLVCGITIISVFWLFHIVIFRTPYNNDVSESDISVYFLVYVPIITLFFYLSFRQLVRATPLRPNEYSSSELLENAQLLYTTIVTTRLYQNPDLKISTLSQTTGINQKAISFTLNHHIRKGFNEYINEFRVNQALERLKKGDHKHITLEGLALEVGFSSRSTFYRVFKQQTGEHPSVFIKN